jgi:fibronectin type 3 domain-containing protein
VTASSLTLTWVDTSTNETGFEIERSLQEDFSGVEIFAADMNETRYEDSQLMPETQYYYRVRAINAVGESAYSQALMVETAAAALAPPQAPSDLAAQVDSSSTITLTWSDNSDSEAGFTLMGSLDGSSFEELHTTARNVHTYAHEGLTPETTYYYYVIAYNGAGESEASEVVQAQTQAEPEAAPTPPEDLAYSELTSNSVRLTWTDTSDDEAGFRLERSQTDDFALVDAFTLDPNTTTYQDSNLLPDTRYYYRVVAFNAAGDSDVGNGLEVQTPEEILPLPAPTALGVQDNTPTTITLTWQDNSGNEEGFSITYSTNGGQTFMTLDTTAADQTIYTHSGLDPETTYHYRVYAYLGQQTSDYSNTLAATTDPLPPVVPTAPSLLEATSILAHSIVLTWQDNSDNEDGFRLERADDENFTAVTPFDIAADETRYEDTGLAAETIYYYRIRAYNPAGDSPYADPIPVTTVSEPPVATPIISD